jgi:hypothetical protein
MSVADPDPGSDAFLPPGSGIRDGAIVLSGSGIRDKKQNLLIAFIQEEVGSGIRIRDGAMVGSGIRYKTSRIRNTGTDDSAKNQHNDRQLRF